MSMPPSPLSAPLFTFQPGGCCAAHAMTGTPHARTPPPENIDPAEALQGGQAPRNVVRHYALIDELLEARRTVFGGTEGEPVYQAYRNHAYRILNWSRQWTAPSPERDDKIAICAVFHDLAAWPNDNLDYLRPSADQADAYLDQVGRGDWKPEMRLMIESHHKITPYRGTHREWVEPIRRADWCDVSFTLIRHGLPSGFVRDVTAAFPIRAFYPNHVLKVSGKWLLKHPLNPLPIMRW